MVAMEMAVSGDKACIAMMMILYKTTLNEAMLMEGDCDDDAGVDHDNDDVDKRDGDH